MVSEGSLTSLLPPWTKEYSFLTSPCILWCKTFLKNIRLNDPTTEWELSQNKFGYYFVGLEVLVMLGYVQRTKSVILPGNKEDVL
jgi:hypothetical protein